MQCLPHKYQLTPALLYCIRELVEDSSTLSTSHVLVWVHIWDSSLICHDAIDHTYFPLSSYLHLAELTFARVLWGGGVPPNIPTPQKMHRYR